MPSCYLQIAGLILDILGAAILATPLFGKAEDIQKQTKNVFGGNPYLQASFYRDRKFALVGILLLAAGFALQLTGVVLSWRMCDG